MTNITTECKRRCKHNVRIDDQDQKRAVIKAVSAATAVSKPVLVSAPRDAALTPVGVVLVSELETPELDAVVVLYKDLGKAKNIGM